MSTVIVEILKPWIFETNLKVRENIFYLQERLSLFHVLVDALTRKQENRFEATSKDDSGSQRSQDFKKNPNLNLNDSSLQSDSPIFEDVKDWPSLLFPREEFDGVDEEEVKGGPQPPPWKWLQHLSGKSPEGEKGREIAYLLAEFGEDVDGFDEERQTPLYKAVFGREFKKLSVC